VTPATRCLARAVIAGEGGLPSVCSVVAPAAPARPSTAWRDRGFGSSRPASQGPASQGPAGKSRERPRRRCRRSSVVPARLVGAAIDELHDGAVDDAGRLPDVMTGSRMALARRSPRRSGSVRRFATTDGAAWRPTRAARRAGSGRRPRTVPQTTRSANEVNWRGRIGRLWPARAPRRGCRRRRYHTRRGSTAGARHPHFPSRADITCKATGPRQRMCTRALGT
jgi:hypothetical protein